MGDKTKIEWTDATWNPVTGCRKVSAGCDNCYAARTAKRLKAMGSPRYQKNGPDGPGFGVTCHPDILDQPARWRKPRMIFVCSMGDLFHSEVPDQFIHAVIKSMWDAPHHVFQVLTKRPRRAAAFFKSMAASGVSRMPPNNMWMGTSVEDQDVDHRVTALMRIPARVLFLSMEPLLGPVIIPERFLAHNDTETWVIAGGESGPGARPSHPQWFRSIKRQCANAGVPFFFKQWGEWSTIGQAGINPTDKTKHVWTWESPTRGDGPSPGVMMWRFGKANAGRSLDGHVYDAMPHAHRVWVEARDGVA